MGCCHPRSIEETKLETLLKTIELELEEVENDQNIPKQDFGNEECYGFDRTSLNDSLPKACGNPVLSPYQQQAYHPTYIYSCINYSCKVIAVKLSTRQATKIKLPCILFGDIACYLVMLPTGKIFFPFIQVSKDFYYSEDSNESIIDCEGDFKTALVIDSFKEFAVLEMPQLPRERNDFVAIYHSSYVYVIGGTSFNRYLKASKKCERFDCRTNRWETIAPLPQECHQANAVETNN